MTWWPWSPMRFTTARQGRPATPATSTLLGGGVTVPCIVTTRHSLPHCNCEPPSMPVRTEYVKDFFRGMSILKQERWPCAPGRATPGERHNPAQRFTLRTFWHSDICQGARQDRVLFRKTSFKKLNKRSSERLRWTRHNGSARKAWLPGYGLASAEPGVGCGLPHGPTGIRAAHPPFTAGRSALRRRDAPGRAGHHS